MKTKLLASLITALLVTGCGGGSNMDDKNKKTSKSNPTTPSTPSSPDTNTGGDKDDGKGGDTPTNTGTNKQLSLRVLAKNICGAEVPVNYPKTRVYLFDTEWNIIKESTVDDEGRASIDITYDKEFVNLAIKASANEPVSGGKKSEQINISSYNKVPFGDLGNFLLDIKVDYEKADLRIQNCGCKDVTVALPFEDELKDLTLFGAHSYPQSTEYYDDQAKSYIWPNVKVCKGKDGYYPTLSTIANNEVYLVSGYGSQKGTEEDPIALKKLPYPKTGDLTNKEKVEAKEYAKVKELPLVDGYMDYSDTSMLNVTSYQKPSYMLGESLNTQHRIEEIRIADKEEAVDGYYSSNVDFEFEVDESSTYEGVIAKSKSSSSTFLCNKFNTLTNLCKQPLVKINEFDNISYLNPLSNNSVYSTVVSIEKAYQYIGTNDIYKEEKYNYFVGYEYHLNTKTIELPSMKDIQQDMGPSHAMHLQQLRNQEDFALDSYVSENYHNAKISALYTSGSQARSIQWEHYTNLSDNIPKLADLISGTPKHYLWSTLLKPGRHYDDPKDKSKKGSRAFIQDMKIEIFRFAEKPTSDTDFFKIMNDQITQERKEQLWRKVEKVVLRLQFNKNYLSIEETEKALNPDSRT